MDLFDEMNHFPAWPAVLLRESLDSTQLAGVASGFFISLGYHKPLAPDRLDVVADEGAMTGAFYPRKVWPGEGESYAVARIGDIVGIKTGPVMVLAYRVTAVGPRCGSPGIAELRSDELVCEFAPEMGSLHGKSVSLDAALLAQHRG